MSQQQQMPHNDVSALVARVTSVEFHVESAEKNIGELRSLLANYVPARENDLKLQSIQETVKRIEADVIGAKSQLTEMNTKLAAQERASQQRDTEQRESQDKLQIRVLWGIVSTIIVILSGILIGYATHLFH